MSKDDFFQRLFASISDCYENDQFCDVRLYGRRSKLDFTLRSVSCHSIVLCSVAPAFTTVLQDVPVDPIGGMKCVYFPDVNFTEIQKFVEQIYKGISSDEFELTLSQGLATVLGIVETHGSSTDSDDEMGQEAEESSADFLATTSFHLNDPDSKDWSPKTGNTSRRRGPSYTLTCPFKSCRKVFSNIHRRNVHVAKTHGRGNGGECQTCGKKVSNSLDEHRKMFHTSKDCLECNLTFEGLKALVEHQRKIHSNIHTCQICGLKFSGRLKWLTHMRRSHDKRSDDATLTPFFCDVCHKSFIIKNQLLEHIKVDHSNKPFILKQSDSKSIEL